MVPAETFAGERAASPALSVYQAPMRSDAPAPEAPHPDVHVGRDGWLFLTGGSNRVLAQYGAPGFSRAALWRWRRLLEDRVRRCNRLGIRFAHVVAPEKLSVQLDALDGLEFDPDRAPALRLARWLRLSIAQGAWIDLVGPFRARARATALYRRTDSHWTFAGGLLAYQTICRHLGVAPREDFEARRTGSDDLMTTGDLGLKLDPPRAEVAESCVFASEARRVHANRLLLELEAKGRGYDAHIGAQAVFRNAAAPDPRRLVLFGDSYAHHTPNPRTGTLTPLLADTFAEVHMLWSTSVDWAYLERVRPDFVVTEIAERFMIDLPQRNFSIERLAELAMARKGV